MFHFFFINEDNIFAKPTAFDVPNHSKITASLTSLIYLITGDNLKRFMPEVSVDELEKRIPLSRRQILRLRTEDRKAYELDQVIAICIGLNLPPWLSDILLDKAGLVVKRYGAYGYYGTILDCFYMDTIKDVQQFLNENGYPPLKLNFDAEN